MSTQHFDFTWIKYDPKSWIADHILDFSYIEKDSFFEDIERSAEKTNDLGPQPLWIGYGQVNATRLPNEVRVPNEIGQFFRWIVKTLKPYIVVEIGTGFGISGMYWLVGLQKNGCGELLTFEVNESWAKIAEGNLQVISNQFNLVVGAFEENIDRVLGNKLIDIAFIDGIHKSDFVFPQFELIIERLVPCGIVLFDDIDFSTDMVSCWKRISNDKRVRSSLAINSKVGLIEVETGHK